MAIDGTWDRLAVEWNMRLNYWFWLSLFRSHFSQIHFFFSCEPILFLSSLRSHFLFFLYCASLFIAEAICQRKLNAFAWLYGRTPSRVATGPAQKNCVVVRDDDRRNASRATTTMAKKYMWSGRKIKERGSQYPKAYFILHWHEINQGKRRISLDSSVLFTIRNILMESR